jgi:hypothetical protein
VAVECGHSFDLIRQLVSALNSALNSHERDRQLGRLQARIDALTVRLDTVRKSTDLGK